MGRPSMTEPPAYTSSSLLTNTTTYYSCLYGRALDTAPDDSGIVQFDKPSQIYAQLGILSRWEGAVSSGFVAHTS